MSFKWDVAPDLSIPELTENYTKAIFLSGRRAAKARAVEAEQWMKATHPWTNRTGAAEAGLHVDVLESPGVLAELIFSHDDNLDYPVWLEIANGGRFAIIAPAIDFWGPKLMNDVQRIVNLGLTSVFIHEGGE